MRTACRYFTALLVLFGSFIVQEARAEEKCYVDRKKEVCFPLGVRSFADAIVSFDVGKPKSKFASAHVPSTVLGEPDEDPVKGDSHEGPQHFLTLGCGGTLTFQFRDNALVDVPGPDLYVFEIGKDVEPTHLSISVDGKNWIDAGTIKGGLASADIGPVSRPGEEYRFVRLQDAKKRCGSRWPGADINAVGAIGSVAITDGRLQIVAASDLMLIPSQIGLIFDASGSMYGRLATGETKIAVAKAAMRSIVETLPGNANVGLRIYGHRLPRRPKKASCSDSELVVPFGALDRSRIIETVNALKPKGQTPIGRSLSLMSSDFGGSQGFKLIIVISDGIETCSPKSRDADFPPTVVRAMQAKGIKFRVNVVGFDIESSETRQFLTRIAEASGGRYIGARNANELENALRGAIELAYAVQDRSGKTVFEGTVGAGSLDLPPGNYSVLVLNEPEFTIEKVTILPGKETRLNIRQIGASPRVDTEFVSLSE